MLEYTYKERFCPTIRYSVSEDGKWFCTEGREGGNEWRSWMWLPELNPDCTCISTSAAGYRIWSLCCGIAALLFLVLAAVQWGMENFTSRGDRLGNVFFVLVVCAVFGGLALALNILWRKKRGTVLNFDSFLQDRRIVLILPVRNRPESGSVRPGAAPPHGRNVSSLPAGPEPSRQCRTASQGVRFAENR